MMKAKFFLAFFVFSILNLSIVATEDEDQLKGKIESIVLKTVNMEGISLQRSITKLQELSKSNDPEKKGIMILQKLTPEDKKKIIHLETTDMPLRDAIEFITANGGIKNRIEGKYLVFYSDKFDDPDKAEAAGSRKNKNEEKEMLLNAKFLKSLITVEGKKGAGSGFIVNFNGKKTLVTNIHVIFNNTEIAFRDINNNLVPVTNMYLSKERDIFLADVDSSFDIPALEMETDVSTVKMGSNVAVFGNSQGSGVNTEVKGKLLGAGGRTIELNAPFVSGNSGSPIILQSNGKVLGVATYVTYKSGDWSDFDSSFVYKPRRFAQRIDNITAEELQPMDMNKYKADLRKYNDLIDACVVGYNLYKDIPQSLAAAENNGSLGTIDAIKYKDFTSVYNILNDWNKKIEDNNKKQANGRGETNVLVTNLKTSLQQIKTLLEKSQNNYKRSPIYYKYIAEESEKYSKILEFIIKIFDRNFEYMDKVNQSVKTNKSSRKL